MRLRSLLDVACFGLEVWCLTPAGPTRRTECFGLCSSCKAGVQRLPGKPARWQRTPCGRWLMSRACQGCPGVCCRSFQRHQKHRICEGSGQCYCALSGYVQPGATWRNCLGPSLLRAVVLVPLTDCCLQSGEL